MTHEQILQEIALLPPVGVQQVERFVAQLRQTYESSPREAQPPTSDWETEGFLGMWRDRDDMQDSTAWVRQQRCGIVSTGGGGRSGFAEAPVS